LGVEAIAQAKNPVLFGLTSGTGKMGGVLISGSLDNTFFGNRAPELDEQFIERHLSDRQFENKKNTLALGAKLYSTRRLGLDIGVIAKRHQELKDINLGGGLSARLGPFHFGTSLFKDSYLLEELSETFTVTTFTAGVRIKNLALDVASINSKLKYYSYLSVPDTKILIYSASFYYEDLLLNAALRKENSAAKTFQDPGLVIKEEEKSSPYFSIQYSLGKHVIFGIMYNYFLLKEASASLTLYI
jgi:hypothetical protein